MMLNSKRVVVVVEEEKQEEERMRPRGNENNNNTTIAEEEEEEEVDAAKALKYRGVRKRKWGKWVSEIRLPNSRERIWLGSYDSPEKAARAFDAALFCLRGNLANFNFPHQPPDIPGAAHLHPSQIQQVAAHYASASASSASASSSSSSSSSSSHHDQLHATNPMDVIPSSCTFLLDDHHDNINFSNIPDFGIFPGFDDYFMPLHPTSFTTADDDDHYLAYDSQDPCHLWNF